MQHTSNSRLQSPSSVCIVSFSRLGKRGERSFSVHHVTYLRVDHSHQSTCSIFLVYGNRRVIMAHRNKGRVGSPKTCAAHKDGVFRKSLHPGNLAILRSRYSLLGLGSFLFVLLQGSEDLDSLLVSMSLLHCSVEGFC